MATYRHVQRRGVRWMEGRAVSQGASTVYKGLRHSNVEALTGALVAVSKAARGVHDRDTAIAERAVHPAHILTAVLSH
eukprot:6632374-Prymnesium_polylepis.1